MAIMRTEYKELSDAERLAIAEELRMPVDEICAMLFGAIALLLFYVVKLKL